MPQTRGCVSTPCCFSSPWYSLLRYTSYNLWVDCFFWRTVNKWCVTKQAVGFKQCDTRKLISIWWCTWMDQPMTDSIWKIGWRVTAHFQPMTGRRMMMMCWALLPNRRHELPLCYCSICTPLPSYWWEFRFTNYVFVYSYVINVLCNLVNDSFNVWHIRWNESWKIITNTTNTRFTKN
jgi:hypothetical protein